MAIARVHILKFVELVSIIHWVLSACDLVILQRYEGQTNINIARLLIEMLGDWNYHYADKRCVFCRK
jgi:hypothetical protein